MLKRALAASITDLLVYGSSLIDWSKQMGLTLNRAPIAEIPLALSRFLAAAHTTVPRFIFYTDG
jgi:hypothetical protein